MSSPIPSHPASPSQTQPRSQSQVRIQVQVHTRRKQKVRSPGPRTLLRTYGQASIPCSHSPTLRAVRGTCPVSSLAPPYHSLLLRWRLGSGDGQEVRVSSRLDRHDTTQYASAIGSLHLTRTCKKKFNLPNTEEPSSCCSKRDI